MQFDKQDGYFKATSQLPARSFLVENLKHAINRTDALDLGCGSGRDTQFLSKEFEQVVAVDIWPKATEFLPLEVEFHNCSFAEFNFPENKFDLINAAFSLPFMDRATFGQVWPRILSSLRPSGLLIAQLFGIEDDWATDQNKTFHTQEEIKDLLQKMEVLQIQEEKEVKKYFSEQSQTWKDKNWHVFHIVAKKL